jgi:hypothetical protein
MDIHTARKLIEEIGALNEEISPELVQMLFSTACRAYAAHAQLGQTYPISHSSLPLTATDAMIVAGALLKAVDLTVFDLGMWQSWKGS